MSVQKIIQESLGRNPLAMKEALEEELRARVAEAIAEKMEEVELGESDLSSKNLHLIADQHERAAKRHNSPESKENYLSQRSHEGAFNRHKDAAKAHREAAEGKVKHSSEKLEKMSNHAWDATEFIKKRFDESLDLDEAFEEGDKVHFQDEYGQKLHGHITKPFSAKKNGAKHAEVRLVGGMGTKMHVPHGQLKKVYEEVELDEAVEQLDELSPKTLISYRKKADKHIDKLQKIVDRSDKIIYKHHLAAGRSKGADRIASNARSDAALRQAETEAGRAARTASTTAKKAADAEKIKDAANRKIDQRDLGRDRAYDRLHKEEVELDEAKIGDRVKIHKPGKDYHGHIGTVGEVRKRTYGTGAPSYTVDYYKPGSDHRHSVTLARDEFKKHKEQRGLLDAKESFDLSDLTLEELETFMESAEFDQLDEISKDLARRYIKGAKTDMAIAQKYHRVGAGGPENTKMYQKRKAGVDKATSRLAK